MGQDKELPAGSEEQPETPLTGDNDADNPSLVITWPDSTSEPVEKSTSKIQDLYNSGDEAGLKEDVGTKHIAQVQIEIDVENTRDFKGPDEASTNSKQRHDLEYLDLQEHYMKIQNAMDKCAPDLTCLLHNGEPVYLRREDFKLPADLCTYTLNLMSTLEASVGINNIDGAALGAQPCDRDTVQKLKQLALTQMTVLKHIHRPLQLLYFYINVWHLLAVDHEKSPGADPGLDPTVPTPKQAEMDVVLELTHQNNKLSRAFGQLLVQFQAQTRAQRAEPSPSKSSQPWDWQQATRVCLSCRTKFEIQTKDKEMSNGEACMEASYGEDKSTASSSFVPVSWSDNGEPGAAGEANVAENMDDMDDMDDMADESMDDSATFDEEQATLLQQPRYVSPADFPTVSVAQSQEELEILQPTPRYPPAPSPPRLFHAHTSPSPRYSDADTHSPSWHLPSDAYSVASILESYGPSQHDSAEARREQYWEDRFSRQSRENEALMDRCEEMADRCEKVTRIYDKSTKRYSDLTRWHQDLSERHEDMKMRFEEERRVHNRVMAAYVTNAVNVNWTSSSSRWTSHGGRSTSPPVSPRGTVSPMTVPTSLDSTESSLWGNMEPRAGGNTSQQAQGTSGFEQRPPATAARPRRGERQTSATQVGQALSFSDFVENQCQSWVIIYDFLWSFVLPIPQPPIPMPSAGGSSSPIHVSRRMAELGIPWSALFNVLNHIILIFGMQTWIACAKERNTWLYANNIKPTTLLSSYVRGERSFWPGWHGGLLTGAELTVLLMWACLNSQRVLEVLGRVVQGFKVANRESMRVVVLGAVVFMFARFG